MVHGTGVGKTCASISIAEGFKDDLKKINKKILVITTLKKNFIKELFDFNKDLRKKKPDEIVQCTGRAYEISDQFKLLSFKKKKVYI
jgi:Rad3-related DNA helicase